jgi:phospholipase/carboxylesterase
MVAGILGYSGALLGDPGQAAHRPPVHLIHGQMDTVVPIMAYYDARNRLEAAGYPVTGHVAPALGHSIDDTGLRTGAEFLQKGLDYSE